MPRLILRIPFLSEKRSFGSVFFWARCATGFGLLLLGLAWVAPNHYPPWLSFHAEMLALLGFGLWFAGQLVLLHSKYLRLPLLSAVILVMACLPWLQVAFGVVHFYGDALLVSFYFAGLLAAIWLGFTHSRAQMSLEGAFPAFMVLVCTGALLCAAVGLVQWLGLTQGDLLVGGEGLGQRVVGNFAQSNHMASMLVMGMVALIYLLQRAWLGRLGFLLGLGFLSALLVLTQSRTGLLAVCALAAFLLLKRPCVLQKIPAWCVLLWPLGLIGANQGLPKLLDWLHMAGHRNLSLTDGSGRLELWQQFWQGILLQPWTGYGWNLASKAQMAAAPQYPSGLPSDYAHNIFLDLLAWNGLPLGLLLILVSSYWLLNRVWRVRESDAIFAMAFLMPLLVHSLLEYPFAYSYFLLPAGFMVGVIEASLSRAQIKLSVKWAVAALVLFSVLGALMVREYFLIEEDFRVVRFENQNVGETPVGYEVPDIYLANHMAAMLRASRDLPVRNMHAAKLANLRHVAERFVNGGLAARYTMALALNGDADGASREMVRIRGLYGERFYQRVKAELLAEAETKYPELKTVKMP